MQQLPVLAPTEFIPVTARSEGRAWTCTVAPGVAVINQPPERIVTVADVVFARYRIGQRTEERLSVVRLLETGLLNQTELAKRWGIARKSLYNWRRAYRAHGVEGLLSPMPAEVRSAMADEIRAAAEAVLRDRPDASLGERNRLLAAGGHGMLRERDWVGIRRALGIWGQLEYDMTAGEAASSEPAAAARCNVQVPRVGGPGPSPVELGSAEGVPTALVTVVEPGQSLVAPREPAAASERAEQVATVTAEVLEPVAVPHGARFSRWAGLALLLPLMAQLLAPVLSRAQQADQAQGRRWSWRTGELLQALLLYTAAGYLNPEQTKAAPRRQMGWLIGRYALPSCTTLRRWLFTLRGQRLHAWLPLELARQYLRLGWVELGGWFVDGHFVPYHGQGKLTKAWWPQRRLAHRGHHQYWVNDRRGRPLVAFLAQGFQVFAHMLPVVAESLRDLLAGAGLPGVAVIVFDRGGYSARLFRTLDGMGIGWITWRKAEVKLPAELFTQVGSIHTAHRPPRPIRYAVTTMRVQGYRADVLAVAWHDGDPQKQVALLANVDRVAPGQYTPLDLIRLLEGRWSQENFFQSAERRQDLGWLDGYDIEQMDEHAQVPNPERLHWEDRRAYLQQAVARQRQKVAALRTKFERRKRKGDWVSFLRLKGSRKVLQRYEALGTAYREAQERCGSLPEQVPYLSLHEGQRDLLRVERGSVVVAVRAAAWHLRQRLLLMAEPFFPDYRERGKFIDVLLQGGGWWHRSPDGLIVILKAPETPCYYRAAGDLLDHWNRIAGAGMPRILLETKQVNQPQLGNA